MKFDLTSSVPVCTTSIPGLFSSDRRTSLSKSGRRVSRLDVSQPI